MKTRNDIAKLMLATAVAGAVSLGATGLLAKGNPGAKSVDQLTADWWQWVQKYEVDFSAAGLVDCSLGQKREIWYLTGTSLGTGPVDRECMDPIPAGKRLFFPLVNLNWANADAENLSVLEKRELLDGILNDIEPGILFDWVGIGSEGCKLSAYVDGEPVIYSGTATQRVQSPTFEYTATNPDGSPAQPDPEAVSDGFWVLLPALSPGDHTIRFTGRLCEYETGDVHPAFPVDVDVIYEVTIVE